MKLHSTSHVFFIIFFFATFLRSSVAKVSNARVKNPGLFYLFVSGQIILLDAEEKKYVKSIRAFDKTGIPFPNKCSGNPFNGTWNDFTLGVSGQTIFMSTSYLTKGSQRLSGLTDAIYVVDTKTQEITARINVIDNPVHIYYVPFENAVWSHNDGVGTFTVVSAAAPYDIIEENTTSPRIVTGHGKLIYDERLGSTGFKTTVTLPGTYVMDLSDPNNSANNVQYLNITEVLTEEQAATCGGTHGIGYSSLSNEVYVGCIPKSSVPSTTISYNGDSLKFVKFWNFTSNQLYTTPDQAFVISTDGRNSLLNLLYITADDVTHYQVQLKTNSTPSYVVVYPKGDYYWAFVSLLNAPQVAILDFNGIVKCIGLGNCTTSALSEYVSYIDMGYHNPPNAPSTLAKYRPIDAGHRYVCTSALYENSVYCYDTQTARVDKYVGLESIQRIVFVEGELSGTAPSGNVSTTYDCSTAPTKIAKVQASGAKSLAVNFLIIFALIVSAILF